MGMPSVTFFALLNEGYRGWFRDKVMQANIASVPHADKSERRQFISSLEGAGRDPNDILDTENLDDYSGIETLRAITHGN